MNKLTPHKLLAAVNNFGFRIVNCGLVELTRSAIRNNHFLTVFILVLFLFSCKKDQVIQTAGPSYSYVPIDTGRWILYNVDSTYYSVFTTPPATNFKFQVLERIDSTYIDNQGRPTQRIERFRRDSANGPWHTAVVAWNSTLTLQRYERVEDNARFVKLGFPINLNTTWDGNDYNTIGEDIHEYLDIHLPYSIGTFNFDSVLVVTRGQPPNAIERKNGKVIYAARIGMVYTEYYNLDIQQFTDTTGTKYFYTIVAYGLNNAPVPIQ